MMMVNYPDDRWFMVPTKGYEVLFRPSMSIWDSEGLPRYTQGYTVLQSDPKSPHLSSSPLLSPESFAELFSPSLGNDNTDEPEKIANKVSGGHHYPARPNNMHHFVCGILNLEDRDGGRKANSVSWAGVAKGEWWIDHTTGLAVRPS